jgi:hypothetical protein
MPFAYLRESKDGLGSRAFLLVGASAAEIETVAPVYQARVCIRVYSKYIS